MDKRETSATVEGDYHEGGGGEEDKDVLLFNKKRRRRNIELSGNLGCVTPAKDFRTFALYEDDAGRLYVPRVVLTETINKSETKLDTPERDIYFDVYILPLPRVTESTANKLANSRDVISASTARQKRVKPKRFEKASPPEEGEKIVLHLRKQRAVDKVSVKAFIGTVQEVYWGSLTVEAGKDRGLRVTREENLGTIRVSVSAYEDFTLNRSLIVQPDYEMQFSNREIPL
jgi:hypothetical protein